MAQITVNHNQISYLVDNGVNRKAFKFNNAGGGTQRTFLIETMNIDVLNMKYEVRFIERDTDEVNNYESPDLARVATFGEINLGWITQGRLDLRLWKIDAINSLFFDKLEIEPLSADGTVKPEFQ